METSRWPKFNTFRVQFWRVISWSEVRELKIGVSACHPCRNKLVHEADSLLRVWMGNELSDSEKMRGLASPGNSIRHGFSIPPPLANSLTQRLQRSSLFQSLYCFDLRCAHDSAPGPS